MGWECGESEWGCRESGWKCEKCVESGGDVGSQHGNLSITSEMT